VRELAERFLLGLWDKGMRYGRRERRGGIGTTIAGLEAGAAVAERELERGAGDLSARELLDRLDVPPGAREALLARVEISSASSADVVAARDLAGIAHVDDDPAPSIAGGNQRLALALAGTLGRSACARRSSKSLGTPAACACGRPARRSRPTPASWPCRRASWGASASSRRSPQG
jgi:hypothetical protein